ncbi:Ig-like domain-containing protein [Microbacterium sp. AG157]|uniref:Ig-like domain-containing protein n=1 Tax=Microbacterium sp. AG157 TaxID=2183993 RepID=UPI0011C07748|nr:Ig-like domain-containing protein [Microbacterium sp. AG157]
MTAAITFAGATTAEAVNTSCDSGLCRAVFVYSGLPESWEVPAGVTSITAVVEGGSGGHAMNDGTFFGGSHGAGGLGGTVRATLPVQPGDELALVVGGAGQDGVSDANTYAPGGYGGGGFAGKRSASSTYASGGGGGGSFLFSDAGALLIAAGGGGGASIAGGTPVPGGAGGTTGDGSSGHGPDGTGSYAYSGGGATASGPGPGGTGSVEGAPGSSYHTSSTAFALGGSGANNSGSSARYAGGGGGGGGGYFAGGGGGTDGGETEDDNAGAGGGGSGFVAATATNATALDGNFGNGKIVITYDDPSYATTLELKASDKPNDATATTLTAVISPATAAGTVTFKEGDTVLGSTTFTDGTATLLRNFAVGSHTVTASYSGDSSHSPSTTSTTFTVVPYTKSPSFQTDSAASAPIEKNVVAGQSFSFDDLVATGVPTPTYTVENDDTDSTVLPDGVTFTNGILAGSSTRAGTWKVKVTATNSVGTATEYVKLTIAPGTATALEAAVSPGDSSSTTLWAVAPDGTVTEPSNSTATHTTITANQGDSIVFETMPVDQYGNPTTKANVQPVTTSSIDTDTITYDPTTNLTTVTFNHASPHVITFTIGGLTNSFAVQVTPTPTPSTSASATTSTSASASTGTPASSSGSTSTSNHLAITGSAPLAPLGWALCILAAGVAVMLLQRHRTTRRPN